MRMRATWVALFALTLGACGWNGAASGSAGPTVSLPWTPPPVRGGTLTVRSDGSELLLVNRDRAIVHALTLSGHRVTDDRVWQLTHDQRPERAVYAGADRRIAILSDGQLVQLDGDAITPVADTCAGPRGLAWDATRERAWVTCASGELVGVPFRQGDATIRRLLAPDLGDVLVRGDQLWVAEVRRARVLRLNAVDGQPTTPLDSLRSLTGTDKPQAAIRMVDGGSHVYVLHELMRDGAPASGSTWGGATACVSSTVTVVVSSYDNSGHTGDSVSAQVPYASDVAFDASRQELAVSTPSSLAPAYTGPNVVTLATHAGSCPPPSPATVDGQPTAIAYLPDGTLIVQTREPGNVKIGGTTYAYASSSVRDTGHNLFHTSAAPGGVPCVSCHIDGSTDGHVWDLGQGPRSTLTLRGGLLRTAPFHWDGSKTDMTSLMASHFPAPDGTTVRPDQVQAFDDWVDALPGDPHPAANPALVQRGQALFDSLGCSGCHGSDATTPMPDSVDYGQGPMQVPSLVDVGQQAVFGHDGCATSLDDLLTGSCGWPQHTVDSTDDRAALAAFLGVASPMR